MDIDLSSSEGKKKAVMLAIIAIGLGVGLFLIIKSAMPAKPWEPEPPAAGADAPKGGPRTAPGK